MAPVVLFLLQTMCVFNDNELNMCDECQKKKIIKLQMYVLLYKNKYITKTVEIVKHFESYS